MLFPLKDLNRKEFLFLMLLVLPACSLEKEDRQSTESVFLEYVDLTKNNITTMVPLLNQLEEISVNAFLAQETIRLRTDQPEIYEDMRRKGESVDQEIRQWWSWSLAHVNLCFAHKVGHVPLAIIKNINKDIMGFALFHPLSRQIIMAAMQLKQQWGKESSVTTSRYEVFVDPLVVKPEFQGRGIGKKLLFSILSHCPQLTTIYLLTHASQLNKHVQRFYEHCGFMHTATYVDGTGCEYKFYEFSKK